jgi:hypothetical protein
LVQKYSTKDRVEPLFFKPVKTAVAAYENWLHSPLTHAQISLALNQLLKQPPSDFDNHVYMERARHQMDAEDPTVNAQMNARRIEELRRSVEQRGAKLMLFELPYSPQIEDARASKITRDVVHTEFPNPEQWLHLDYPRPQLRWSDSVHLDERSAVIAAQSIDRALSLLLGPK